MSRAVVSSVPSPPSPPPRPSRRAGVPPGARADRPAHLRSGPPGLRRICGIAAALAIALAATAATGQDWSSEDDDWATEPPPPSAGGIPPSTAWSLRMGLGFVSDPNAFLLAFELPYRFDRFVSAGPLVQVGLHENKLIVAPTANLEIRVPDMPGRDLDRLHPFVFAGVGFAVIEKEERFGDNRSAGFLVNTGFGVDFALSERASFGSRMIFNFLPVQTLQERFFYAWEVGSVKLSF